MSLSNPDVAELINTRFESAWESVRDAPQVTIDFGGGSVVRRTLHGNIATYVCAPDGAVIDVIPGLNDAATYRKRLAETLTVFEIYSKLPAAERAANLRQHHASAPVSRALLRGNLRLLSKSGIELPAETIVAGANGTKPVIVVGGAGGGAGSKGMAELPVERTVAGTVAGTPPTTPAPTSTLAPGTLRASTAKFTLEAPVKSILVAADGTRVDLELLARDTQHNEEVRRPQIDAILAEDGAHTPESLTRRIYRDVLHADLDDPYLGLGETLFKTYPFVR